MAAANVDKPVVSVNDATGSLKNEKAVFVITDMNDYVDIMGYVAYISKSRKTYKRMLDIFRNIGAEGKKAMIIGSYEDGGAVGVQYEVQ